VAKLALIHGASLVVNTDSHAPGDLTPLTQARQVARGAGLTAEQFEQCRRNSEALVKKALSANR
jgi:histidinol phosphatase-like PHP family hydrolase